MRRKPAKKGHAAIRGGGWIRLGRPYNAAFCVSPKAGWTSFHAATKDADRHFLRGADLAAHHALLPRYFIVRNPWDRFVSLWKSKAFQSSDHGNEATRTKLRGLVGLGPDALVDYIRLHPANNWHWWPQETMLDGLEPDRVIKLESLNSWWRGRYGERYPHENKSGTGLPEVTVSDENREWLREFYKGDWDWYNRSV